MEDKSKFAKFISEKRKEAGLTQKELAEKLFVTDTTVSKWERGISYPDITLISSICSELKISEHEFFIACEDVGAREDKVQAKRFRRLKETTFWTLNIMYAIGVVTCFICNLAVNHTLSWFFIVLSSVALAFTITSLPFILKQYRTITVFSIASILIYLVLFICDVYVNGDWFYHKAVPIATISIAWCWFIMLLIRYTSIKPWLKAGIINLAIAVIVMTMNPLISYVIGEEQERIIDYLDFTYWNPLIIGNKIIFYLFIILSVASFIKGFKSNDRNNVLDMK